MRDYQQQRGTTFVELIITILVIGIAVTGILQVMTINTGSSADPMIRHQAIAIAEAYLDEILSKEYTDPDADDTETLRSVFDDVDDYNNLIDTKVRDQGDTANPQGRIITGLENYAVSVSVTPDTLGPTAITSLRVTVTVAPPDGKNIAVTSYRADY